MSVDEHENATGLKVLKPDAQVPQWNIPPTQYTTMSSCAPILQSWVNPSTWDEAYAKLRERPGPFHRPNLSMGEMMPKVAQSILRDSKIQISKIAEMIASLGRVMSSWPILQKPSNQKK